MCGILALFSPSETPDDQYRSLLMPIKHRGPDGEGLRTFGLRSVSEGPCFVALGSRRLEIVGGVAANQPFFSSSGRFCGVFNGEIYNFRQIRSELSPQVAFRTDSDIEVLVEAFAAWGEAALNQFNGDFAFVIYDLETGHFVAARDRFGARPLFVWSPGPDSLVIGSEIKQFRAHPHWQARVNGLVAYDFLAWGLLDASEETMFAGVRQVLPGCLLRGEAVRPAAVQMERWYRPDLSTLDIGLDEACRHYRDLLEDAVRLRLSDQRLSVALSGGMDSSSIYKIACQQQAFPALSVCHDGTPVDETPFIHRIRGTNPGFECRPTSQGLVAELDSLVWHFEEPFFGGSVYNEWCLFKTCKQNGIRVHLDGHGADEILAGYPSFLGPHLRNLVDQGHWISAIRESLEYGRRVRPGLIQLFKDCAREFVPRSLVHLYRSIWGEASHTVPSWMNGRKLGLQSCVPRPSLLQSDRSVALHSQRMLSDGSLAQQLRFADRSSLAHSVENRAPFLDYRLVEFGQRLPPECLLWRGVTKRVLRGAVKDLLPQEVLQNSRKLGYAIPEALWVQEQRPNLKAVANQAYESSQGLFSSAYLDYVHSMLDGKRQYNGYHIWRFLTFGLWCRIFEVKLADQQ